MSRRKINNTFPERLLGERIRELSWNMEINNRFERNNECVVLSDTPYDVNRLDWQGSSTAVQNVYSSDDEMDNIFYKLTICDEIYVNNSVGMLGCLSGMLDCLPSTGKSSIEDTNILIKVHKTVDGTDSAHFETAEAKDANMIGGKRFLTVVATYEQIDSLSYLCKKSVVDLVANFDDLHNEQSQCKIMVYLNEAGFTAVTVPSEDPSMGKSYKSMKTLMQWLHGPLLPDVEAQPSKHYDDQIEAVFSTLKSKHNCLAKASTSAADDILPSNTLIDINDLDQLQHLSLVPLLRGYQKRAVHWMIEQETVDTKVFAMENKIPHPLWKTMNLGDKQACYNPHTGRLCKDPVYHQGYPSGGILADEMGLGKTVEVLACILNNPRQSGTKISESNEEILQTESNTSSPSDSPSSSMSVSDEKETLVTYSSRNEVKVCENNPSSPKTTEEHHVAEVTKRHLPLDSDQHGKKARMESCNISPPNELVSVTRNVIQPDVFNKPPLPCDSDQHGKKARTESCDVSSPPPNGNEPVSVTRNVVQPNVFNKSPLPSDSDQHEKKESRDVSSPNPNEPSSVVKNVVQPNVFNNSPLPSDSVISNIIVGEEKMDCDTSKASKDNVISDRFQEVKIEVQPESKSPTVEKEKTLRCICGKSKADPKEEVLTCTNCYLCQHPQCIGLKKNTDEDYVCPDCSVKMPLLESNTTLIVSPVTIAHQWLDEIHRHILPGSLNVMIYEGVAKQGFVYPSVLADNDIILTTYEVLKRDFHHLPSKKDNHNYRRPKRYATWPCPLTCIKFWRICLDEAQMVENTTAKTTETALNLSAVHRWCITGTPIQKTIDDLHGLFLFLGVEPYYRKTWWKKLLYEPFMRGNSKPLSDVLYNVMWRTAKKDVIDEINLPEQNELLNWLNFSPVEYHFYRRQYEDCSRSALKELKKFQESETELNSLDRYSVHRVLWPLLRLRQACCHPQAVRGGYLAVQKSVITMDQLLESLINKAKNESQDAHRQLLCALNGLAGTYILQENWQNAVDVYREAMASWKEHEELFKTDSLQKLHTLHNLHDVLSKFDSNTRTLADDFLQQKASEIRDKYLQKWKDQVTVAENETSSARQAHDELKHKVDLKCPWWMTYLQDIIDRKNPGDEIVSERLVDKVKSDLTAVRNVQEFGYLSMADSFSDLRGLQLLLVRKFEAIEECRNSLFIELKSLMVEPTKEMVVSAAECCLRPAVNSTAESCCFCRTNDVMSVYESLIFGHQGIKNTDAESIGGLRAETEAVRTLKSIFAFLKSESKRHYKYHIELQQEAQCHLECLDLMKKNFKVYRQLWHALRQRVSALDELAMCTMRLRLKYRGEVVPDNQFYIVHPAEVGTTQMGFRSDKTLANSSLRKCLGQLLYLKNLAKTQSTDGGENSELCPVCTKVLGYEWSVFSCGHCLCCQCMWVLLERPDIPGRAGSNVRCPMCRANTMVQDISYVSTIRQLTEQDKDLVVKGSHSTKIEAAVRTLMRIQRTDPLAKTLVFSTWQDVLDVISRALVENNMKFRSIKKSKDYESSLEEFKTSDDIPILLIPLQSGSNGLNIIEATHVILVEPSLNPSLERQAVGRIHRIGQTKPTFIHRLLIANTVEEKIMRFLQNKTETGLRCGTRRTDGENVPLTVGELTSFFQPTESQPM